MGRFGLGRSGLGRTGVTLVAIVAFSGVAATVVTLAGADSATLVGTMPDDATVTTIGLAAQSCPTLSGPRLAAQLMAAPAARVEPAVFASWAPWPQADAADLAASVYALAHDMCDLVGRVRGVGGDRWRNALAAYHAGAAAVRQAGGVPASARSYVDTVGRYETWYAQQPQFDASTVASTAPPVAVPDELVPAVRAAGSVCPQVTAADVAGQLMASSRFDVNRRGPDGALGVAQFISSMWSTYAHPGSSPWDPSTAIPAVGTAMCALVGQLSRLGSDPYPLAVAAFRTGPTAVRQAGGVPGVRSIKDLVTETVADASFYRQDPRLTAAPVSTPSPSLSPSPTRSARPSPTPVRTPAPSAPPKSPLDGKGVLHGRDGQCLDNNTSIPDDNNPVQLWECDQTDAQVWTVAGGHFQVQGKCLTVPGDAKSGTGLVITTCSASAAETWQAASDNTVRNPASGLCLTAPADFTQVTVSTCDGGPGQRWTR